MELTPGGPLVLDPALAGPSHFSGALSSRIFSTGPVCGGAIPDGTGTEKPPRKKQAKPSVQRQDSNDDLMPKASKPKKVLDRPHKKPGAQKGKLRVLMVMPLDILHEIFQRVTPVDLLHLARASKALRSIILNKSNSTFLWRAVLDAIPGIPPCPDGMELPVWASLAFEKRCTFCNTLNVTDVLWEVRVRACYTCFKDLFTADYYSYDIKWLMEHGQELHRGEVIASASDPRRKRANIVWLKSDLAKFKERIDMLGGDEGAIEAFIEETKANRLAVKAHAALCEAWQEALSTARAAELDQAREARTEAIIVKLRELGWGDEIDFMDQGNFPKLRDQPLCKVPKPLTYRTWEHMKPKLIEFLLEVKKERMKKVKTETIQDRIDKLYNLFKRINAPRNQGNILPEPIEYIIMPEFSRFILDPEPITAEKEQSSIRDLLSNLSTLTSRWHMEKSYNVGQRLPGVAPSISAGASVLLLQRALTVFRCQVCDPEGKEGPIGWPRILQHSCSHKLRRGDYMYNHEEPLMCALAKYDKEPWNSDCFVVHAPYQQAIKAVLIACGRDELTTVAEMDQFDPRLECRRCYTNDGCLLMSWKTAVHHGIAHAAAGSAGMSHPWRMVSQADRLHARLIEDTMPVPFSNHPDMRCNACGIKLPSNACMEHATKAHSPPDSIHFSRHADIPFGRLQLPVRVRP